MKIKIHSTDLQKKQMPMEENTSTHVNKRRGTILALNDSIVFVTVSRWRLSRQLS
jgi:hypothetical protein